MPTRRPDADIKSSEITSEGTYLNRRQFLGGLGVVGSLALTGGLYYRFASSNRRLPATDGPKPIAVEPSLSTGIPKIPDTPTSYEDVTSYNNFYEFSTDKHDVAYEARSFVTRPWTVKVGGLVNKPKTFDIDEILKISPPEERVYRMRCVEGWSMVIPWVGFPLAALLKLVDPNSAARFVRFKTLLDPARFPYQKSGLLDWPYQEGLRLDEALHPLTILAVGLYGKTLPNQNGAPLRLVVPWKYGFKGIKSIVEIELTADQPLTTWGAENPAEYGFYANVNPGVDHPRWSQATERRIGEYTRRPTLMFNGYAEQVGSLYAGMDLRKFY